LDSLQTKICIMSLMHYLQLMSEASASSWHYATALVAPPGGRRLPEVWTAVSDGGWMTDETRDERRRS
jgi:hypothetical protein